MATEYKTSWCPTSAEVEETHLGQLMRSRGCDFEALHAWAFDDPEAYWRHILSKLQIVFAVPPQRILRCRIDGCPGLNLMLLQSCFERSQGEVALVRGLADGSLEYWSRDRTQGAYP